MELTNGLNKITLSVKDRAGNVTVTNLNVTLSYAGATTPTTLLVDWPPADNTGAAVTTWNYNAYRGWLTSERGVR